VHDLRKTEGIHANTQQGVLASMRNLASRTTKADGDVLAQQNLMSVNVVSSLFCAVFSHVLLFMQVQARF
jgi:hypothetical protein